MWQCDECGEVFEDGWESCPFCGSLDMTEYDEDDDIEEDEYGE